MISNDLDLTGIRRTLAAAGRVQVDGFLQDVAAAQIERCLLEDVPWSTAVRGSPDVPAWSDTERAARLQAEYAHAGDFHFVYDRYLIVEAMRAGRDPGLLLHVVLEFLNSAPFIEFIRELTGDAELTMVGAQATRYLPGQFLRAHDDSHAAEARRYAYVINLSRDWVADWGGLLHFLGPDGRVEDVFLPRFNSLSLFKVPHPHFVGLVSPWARRPRLAITGWWHARPPAEAQSSPSGASSP